ncbi:MAG: biotin/lipoyl-binding protein [Pirellulaceae bacterium]
MTEVVTSGPFDHIVLEQGEVESSSNIDVICEVKSRGGAGLPILWVIDEGTYVKKGDKLVELDASALENELKQQRILVSSAEATLISSEALVRTAEIALQEYLQGTYLSERKAILSETAVAEQELRKAELNLDSARRLAAKGMLKGLQIEAEEFAVVNAKNVLESAQARLKVLDELTKEKNKVQFESDIEAAKARMKSDTSVLAEEQDKLTEIEEQIAKCVILSPAEGVVVHNNEFSSRGGAEFVVEQGATVRERQVIIKLPDPSKMQVKAKVNESRITLISAGMAAKVRVGAVEGDMLSRVKKVNKYAEPGSWFSSSVKEYATDIEILNPPENIRTGMTAEVRIFVKQIPNALQIPVHGIYEYKGRHFALVKQGEGWETREITIGATNEKMVTIESGLSENEIVALDPRNHLDLMDLPVIEDVTDRDEIARIGANAEVPTPPVAEVDGPSAAPGAPGEGGRPGGRGGAGGRGGGAGGFDPATMVDRTFEQYDSDSDGKLSAEELQSLDSRFRDRFTGFDANGDGSVEKAEALNGFKNMPRGGGGRPPQ